MNLLAVRKANAVVWEYQWLDSPVGVPHHPLLMHRLTTVCSPALLACRSMDAPITHKSLTQDKSEPFHLCRWVTPQSLFTGLALAN